MFHRVYAGHFEKAEEGQFRPNGMYGPPAALRPLEPDAIVWLGEVAPDDWHYWVEDGRLVFDPHELGLEEIEVLRQLVETMGCQLAYDGYLEISADQLSPNLRILEERGSSTPPAPAS